MADDGIRIVRDHQILDIGIPLNQLILASSRLIYWRAWHSIRMSSFSAWSNIIRLCLASHTSGSGQTLSIDCNIMDVRDAEVYADQLLHPRHETYHVEVWVVWDLQGPAQKGKQQEESCLGTQVAARGCAHIF